MKASTSQLPDSSNINPPLHISKHIESYITDKNIFNSIPKFLVSFLERSLDNQLFLSIKKQKQFKLF